MSKLTRRLALSDDPFAKMARSLYRKVRCFSLPAPRVLVRPALWLFILAREMHHFFMRVFICEPLFKAYCDEYGTGVRTGPYIHWIQGRGRIVIGDNTKLDGKCSINFAARYVDTPTLLIGSHTNVSHNSRFTVGKRITIGSHCRIASDVFIFDASGHASEPEARKAGRPSSDDEVRPVTIEDNVWLGRRVTVFPGVTIGEGSIVSAGSVVVSNVLPFTVVAGNPARRIGTLKLADSVSTDSADTVLAVDVSAKDRAQVLHRDQAGSIN
ncbi:MAG: acyltransferase [Planctomycetota bacterium]|nr:acyltransferase [Planctomycetaceae bacterium]MDQ3332775.1 acyltransferase [Planctomycetota bacterium]